MLFLIVDTESRVPISMRLTNSVLKLVKNFNLMCHAFFIEFFTLDFSTNHHLWCIISGISGGWCKGDFPSALIYYLYLVNFVTFLLNIKIMEKNASLTFAESNAHIKTNANRKFEIFFLAVYANIFILIFF